MNVESIIFVLRIIMILSGHVLSFCQTSWHIDFKIVDEGMSL